jgi:hypothetical protein
MNVLDPFEVADVEAWPIEAPGAAIRAQLDSAEYVVFQRALRASQFGAVLNEKAVKPSGAVELPQSYRRRIVPDEIFEHRKHSDVRIARRASTIASLARVISERKPSHRLRVVLLTQAQRLEHLAEQRLRELAIDPSNLSDEDNESPEED